MVTVLVFLIATAIWFWALFDCVSTPAAKIQTLSKPLWLLLLVLLSWIGAVAWIYFGRPRRVASASLGSTWREFEVPRASRPGTTTTLPAAKRIPIGPDDDPDFLSKL